VEFEAAESAEQEGNEKGGDRRRVRDEEEIEIRGGGEGVGERKN